MRGRRVGEWLVVLHVDPMKPARRAASGSNAMRSSVYFALFLPREYSNPILTTSATQTGQRHQNIPLEKPSSTNELNASGWLERGSADIGAEPEGSHPCRIVESRRPTSSMCSHDTGRRVLGCLPDSPDRSPEPPEPR